MVVGMTTVLMFLLFMILLLKIVANLTKASTAREIKAIEEGKKRLKREREWEKRAAASDQDEDIVVISAAIAAYEAEKFAISK